MIARAKQYCPAEEEEEVLVWRLLLPLPPNGAPPSAEEAVDVAAGRLIAGLAPMEEEAEVSFRQVAP